MGKLILCTGEIAKEPFYFPVTDTRVYSLEELCYYIYNNIYNISEDIFNESLAGWMENHLKMPDTAKKVEKIIKHKGSLKDLVVTILCSADYYEEKEVKGIICILDKLNRMSPLEKKKLRGDNWLSFGSFQKAAEEYKLILKDDGWEKIPKPVQGNIIHNLAVTKFYSSAYEDAAAAFLEAYGMNRNSNSLTAWLFAMKMSGKAIDARNLPEFLREDVFLKLSGSIEKTLEEAGSSDSSRNIEALKALKKAGRVDEYYMKLYGMLSKWKEDYKHGLV